MASITTSLPSAWTATAISGLDLDDLQSTYMWILVVGFIISFILAFGVGANDVANSFATSVGSKVLTLRAACILASFFETAGAVLLGAKVSDTIRKGIFDVTLYEDMTETLMMGQIAALGGACVWLLVATGFKLPVSGTHSIVGGMMGFHLVVFQGEGVNWAKFGLIIASWFISPLLSGIVSSIIFLLYKKYVLNKDQPLEPGLRALPLCYAGVLIINVFSITFDGPEMLGLNLVPFWVTLVGSLLFGLLTGLVVWFVAVPRIRKLVHGDKRFAALPRVAPEEDAKMEPAIEIDMAERLPEKVDPSAIDTETTLFSEELSAPALTTAAASAEAKPMMNSSELEISTETYNVSMQSSSSAEASFFQRFLSRTGFRKMESGSATPDSACSAASSLDPKIRGGRAAAVAAKATIRDPPEVAKLCSPLQILSAVFASFAHGGNDVCNAVGPLVALWSIFQTGSVAQKQSTPIWILFYGGVGITVGLWILGRRVIETVGEKLTPITPSSGFTIELGAAATVLGASKLGIPISTTHCKVGSIFVIGLVRPGVSVEWKVFRNIIVAWGVTLPITAGLSAAIMCILQSVVPSAAV